jgi:hypothetical protein
VVSRVRTALQNGWADPTVRYGAIYVGWVELNASCVSGVVEHWAIKSNRPPMSVVVLRNGEPIGSTKTFVPWNKSWRFKIDVEFDFTREDILKERLRIVALDRVGGESVLKINGPTQLRYIKSV